jgi:hypothetical protein
LRHNKKTLSKKPFLTQEYTLVLKTSNLLSTIISTFSIVGKVKEQRKTYVLKAMF